MDPFDLVVPVCSGLVGVGMFCSAAADSWSSVRLLRRGRRVEGLVLEWINTSDPHEGGRTLRPRIQFHEGGCEREFVSASGWGHERLPPGCAVPVIYDLDDPDRAERAVASILLAPLGAAGLALLLSGWSLSQFFPGSSAASG